MTSSRSDLPGATPPAVLLSAKNWRLETLLRLFVILFLGFAVGGVVVSSLAAMAKHGEWKVPAGVNLVVGTLAFHGTAIPALLWFTQANGFSVRQAFGLDVGSAPMAAAVGAGVGLLGLPAIYGLQALSVVGLQKMGIHPEAQENVKLLLESGPLLRSYIAFFAVGIAPVVEEGLFRGVLLPLFRDVGHCRVGVWGTALLFGLIHFNAAAFLPLTVFGLILAWLYERTGNLLAPLSAHAIFNLTPFVLLAFGVNLDFAVK